MFINSVIVTNGVMKPFSPSVYDCTFSHLGYFKCIFALRMPQYNTVLK